MLTVMIVVFAGGKDANALWEYARMRGWDEHDDITATSQIEELLRLAGMGKVSIVLMSSLIGVARTVPGVLAAVREFIEHGIRLVIPNAKLDTSGMPRKGCSSSSTRLASSITRWLSRISMRVGAGAQSRRQAAAPMV
jgi:hypothetical protein